MRHFDSFTARMYTGPVIVQHYANLARLFFAGALVSAGTEHVWITGIRAASIYDVENGMRELFRPESGFRQGLFIRNDTQGPCD